MIMEVRDDGITVVAVDSEQEELHLVAAIVSVLQNTPELNTLVSAVMSGRLSLDELGVRVNTIPLGKEKDIEASIRSLKGRKPAKDSDIPEFVKRSLHE